jgi:hypothetical protein
MLADMHQVNIHSIELKHKAYVAISSDIYLGTTKGNETHFTLFYHIKIYEAGPHFHLTSVSSSFYFSTWLPFYSPLLPPPSIKIIYSEHANYVAYIE